MAKAKKLFASAPLKDHALEGLGWLLSVLSGDPSANAHVLKIRRFLNNRLTETAAGAHFVSSMTDDAHLTLHSNRRTDGVLLDAFITDQPQSDVIVKLVRGLLAHRKKGRWGNTQENAFILLALDRYFRTYEKATPDFIAKVWLGDGFAGQHRFKGRTADRKNIEVPMSFLSKLSGIQPITLQKTGPGRLYYRLGLKYAPQDLKLKPSDHGFTVTRRYEAVDDPSDVTRNDDGTWVITSGARVRVRLTMVARSRRYHVALVDPLPAGLEPVNPGLARPVHPTTPKGSASFGVPHIGGIEHGTSIRICETNESKRLRHNFGVGFTNTHILLEPPHLALLSCPQPRPRRCIIPKPSVAVVQTQWSCRIVTNLLLHQAALNAVFSRT